MKLIIFLCTFLILGCIQQETKEMTDLLVEIRLAGNYVVPKDCPVEFDTLDNKKMIEAILCRMYIILGD